MNNETIDRQIDPKSLFSRAFYGAWNDFVTGSTPEMWFQGGRGSGKSSFISIAIIAGICAYPDSNAICLRKVSNDLRESVYNQVLWAIDMLGMTDMFKSYSSPLKIVRIDTGQEILFLGLDDPRKRKSIKAKRGYFRYLWLEELDQFAGMEEVRSVRQSVLRGGTKYQSFYCYNPPRSLSNWVNAEAEMAVEGKKVYRSSYLDMPPEWLGIPFITEAEHLKEVRPDVYLHEYMGVPTGTGNEVFVNLESVSLTDNDIGMLNSRGFGIDFGLVNDPTVLLGAGYDRASDTVTIFLEHWMEHVLPDEIAERIIEDKLTTAGIVADTAPLGWLSIIARKGVNIHGCYKSAGWPEEGVSWLRNRVKIRIDPVRCPNAWREFSEYEYRRWSDGQTREGLVDRDNHTIDACRYALEGVIRDSLHKRPTTRPAINKPKPFDWRI